MGLWLAVVFAKFGTPVIFGELIDPPRTLLEFLLNPWPINWGYFMLGAAAFFTLPGWKWKPTPPTWIVILPVVWFGWQLLSARRTVDGRLTQQTLLDFAACTLCFYVGAFSLSRSRNCSPIWWGLSLGLLFCLWAGLNQHFGGIEETRRYLQTLNWDLYPPQFKAKMSSPEFQQKISSNRIWGTFIYPNALAGGIILALPASLVVLWNLGLRFPFVPRGVLVGTAAYIGIACLVWSGSKAGWLIMLLMMLVVFFHLEQISNRMKWTAIMLLMIIGLGGFYGKYSGYFARKTNSATARLDYWQAGWEMLKEKPFFGSGPGTFMIGYQRLKRPESESAKLAHNDYLQQGSDSGIVGLGSYFVLVAGSIAVLHRRMRPTEDWMRFAVWLGVAGLAAQELVEFSLYIPALAWPFFLFLGWLWGRGSGGAAGCLPPRPKIEIQSTINPSSPKLPSHNEDSISERA